MTVTLIRPPSEVQRASLRKFARWRLPLGLGLFGFLAAFAGSWIPAFWGDEAASVMSAERTVPSLFGMLKNVDAVHGLYYLFLHFWIQAFGASELSVRLPSAIAVGVFVAGTFVLGRMLMNRNMAIVAAVIAAVLPRSSYLGADARSYALTTAMAVWITIVFLILLRHQFTSSTSRTLAWVGYACGLAIGIYLFLYLGLLLLVHGAFLFTSRTYRRHRKLWLLAAALAVTLALPIVAEGYAQRSQIAFLAHRGYATATSVLENQWFVNPSLAVVAWLLIIAAAISATLTWARSAEHSSPVLLALLWVVLPTLGLLCLNAVTPAYNLRYVSFCLPGVALAMAAGIGTFRHQAVRVALLPILLLLAVPTDVVQRGPYAKDGGSDLAQAAATLGAEAREGDAVIFDETTHHRKRPRLAMHLYPSDFQGLRDVTLKTPYPARSELWDTTHPLAEVTATLEPARRVWLLEIKGSPDNIHGTDVHTLEAAGYEVLSRQVVHRTIIYSFTKRP
ncbi:glycosyltransferase family 39 protein [Cryobacterium sp. PH31-L1]|uniref:glycosyltransferase family 39 protein n=1 Tax=Cryobacterium sp. PH31-L1 TaxID=3046199 RepID=UPI0024BB22D0|nr:glycosyltransferase family 39 protein [Cryobacterium sp. PH31-L1]MDJ0379025.1 glycosyltransferase family 39 protein [Cryobacterium sp. PH31-L1]